MQARTGSLGLSQQKDSHLPGCTGQVPAGSTRPHGGREPPHRLKLPAPSQAWLAVQAQQVTAPGGPSPPGLSSSSALH